MILFPLLAFLLRSATALLIIPAGLVGALIALIAIAPSVPHMGRITHKGFPRYVVEDLFAQHPSAAVALLSFMALFVFVIGAVVWYSAREITASLLDKTNQDKIRKVNLGTFYWIVPFFGVIGYPFFLIAGSGKNSPETTLIHLVSFMVITTVFFCSLAEFYLATEVGRAQRKDEIVRK